MALSTEAIAAVGAPEAKSTPPATPAEKRATKGSRNPDNSGTYTSYRESIFRPASSSVVELGKGATDTGGHIEREVLVTNENYTRYSTFLRNHVERLYKNPTLLNSFNGNALHGYEYAIANALAKTDADGHVIYETYTNDVTGVSEQRMSLDDQKLKSFFDRGSEFGARGWAITTQLIEKEIFYRTIGEALKVGIYPRADHGGKIEEGSYHMGIGRESVGDKINEIIDGIMKGDGRLVSRLWVPQGVRLNVQEKASLRRILTASINAAGGAVNPLERDLLKLYGTNFEDPNLSALSPKERLDEIKGLIRMRYGFMRQIMPESQIDAPYQSILDSKFSALRIDRHGVRILTQDAPPEQSGTYWEVAIGERYRALLAANPLPTENERILAYAQAQSDILLNQITALVANRERVQKEAKSKEIKARDLAAKVNNLPAQLERRKSSTSVVKLEQKEAMEAKSRWKKKKAELEERKARSSNTELNIKTKAREQAESNARQQIREFETIFAEANVIIPGISADPQVALKQYQEHLEEAVGKQGSLDVSGAVVNASGLRAEIQKLTSSAGRDTRLINIATPELNRLQTKYDADKKKLEDDLAKATQRNEQNTITNNLLVLASAFEENKAKAIEAAREQVKVEFADRKKVLEDYIAKLEGSREKIDALRSQLESTKQDEQAALRERKKSSQPELTENRANFLEIINGQPGQATVDQLRDQSVEQIYQYIITNNTNPPYNFVLATEADEEALKDKIIRAKAETLTDERISLLTQTPDLRSGLNYLAFLTVKGLYGPAGQLMYRPPYGAAHPPLTENELIQLSNDQLLTRVRRDYNVGLFARMSDAQVASALDKARQATLKRFEVSEEIYQDLAGEYYDQQIAEQTKKMEFDFKDEITLLKAAQEVSQNEKQERIYRSSEQIIKNLKDFTDSTVVTAADKNYSEAEQKAGYTKGYSEFLQLFFDYRTDRVSGQELLEAGENVDARFQRLARVFPPRRLAEDLNKALGLGVTLSRPPVDADFAKVLRRLRTQLGAANKYDAMLSLSKGLGKFIEAVVEEAAAKG